MYFIKHNWLMDYIPVDGTLEEAQAEADSRACYTQQDIVIYDDNHKEVSRREWCGVAADEEDAEYDIIPFGDFGFYNPWREEY